MERERQVVQLVDSGIVIEGRDASGSCGSPLGRPLAPCNLSERTGKEVRTESTHELRTVHRLG